MSFAERLVSGVVFLLRQAIGSIVNNLGLALLSLIMALSLWLFVTDRENPREAQGFNTPISIELVNVPDGLAVANVSDAGVRIRVEAPRSELDDLSAEEFKATVDLSGIGSGIRSLAVDVTPPNSRISVVQVTPSRIDVTLELRRSREVPVKISAIGSPEVGFELVGQQADPARVTVTGPESLVDLVDAAVAVVNLTGQRVSLSQRVELEPRDAGDGGISRVTVAPVAATVSIELERRDYSLQFPVTPTFVGAPASGFDVGAVRVEPRIITITAPLDVLQSLASSGVGTSEISLADARDDVIRTVELSLPEGARVEGGTSVRVTVDILPQRGQFTYQVVARARNLGNGLTFVPSDTVRVTLSGDLAVLNSVDPSDIEASVDVKDLGPGLYLVAVSVSPPTGTTIVSIEPPELGIAITLSP